MSYYKKKKNRMSSPPPPVQCANISLNHQAHNLTRWSIYSILILDLNTRVLIVEKIKHINPAFKIENKNNSLIV